jgi:hypothetical protein
MQNTMQNTMRKTKGVGKGKSQDILRPEPEMYFPKKLQAKPEMSHTIEIINGSKGAGKHYHRYFHAAEESKHGPSQYTAQYEGPLGYTEMDHVYFLQPRENNDDNVYPHLYCH